MIVGWDGKGVLLVITAKGGRGGRRGDVKVASLPFASGLYVCRLREESCTFLTAGTSYDSEWTGILLS